MCRLTTKTITPEANPPIRDHGMINTPAQAEYSERLAPSGTCDQYRQYDRRNGVPRAAIQHNTALVTRAQRKASATDTPTIAKVPETKDDDSISSSMNAPE